MSLFVEGSLDAGRALPAEETLRRHGRSFHLASRVLPPAIRARAAGLYAFCRHVDDLADTEQDRNRAERELSRLRDDLVRRSARCPDSARLLQLAAETDLPLEPALKLIDTVSQELRGQRVVSPPQLIDYAYGVAGTVGLMMCKILDARDPRATAHAVDLGIAMQLTNIARDVGEDAAMGRIYLPASWLGAMTPAEILAPDSIGQKALRRATARCLALADAYYDSGLAGLKYLPGRCRYSIAVAAHVYRAIGDRIAAADYQSWDRRAVVPVPARLRIAAGGLVRELVGSPRRGNSIHPNLRAVRETRTDKAVSPDAHRCQPPRTSIY
ncbi:MAG: phytoene/squalene synthase family protein [Wenzhouxiangella sp.]